MRLSRRAANNTRVLRAAAEACALRGESQLVPIDGASFTRSGVERRANLVASVGCASDNQNRPLDWGKRHLMRRLCCLRLSPV